MSELANIISQIGFPIFVAIWMLYKSSKDSEEMRKSINELTNVVSVLTSKLDQYAGGINGTDKSKEVQRETTSV